MDEKREPYPVIILPQTKYKKRLCIEKLLNKYADLMAVRLVCGMEEDFVLESELGEKVINDSVFTNSMANLSMNLAGGVFNTSANEHLRFLPISEYGKALWSGGIVDADAFSSDETYSFNVPCFGLCFSVKAIHERTFPFHKGFKNQQERDEYAKQVDEATTEEEKSYDANIVGEFKKNSPVEVRGRIKVHHSPTNGNYWHITLDTYRPNEKDFVLPDGRRQGSDKQMFKALKQDLVQRCDVNASPNYKISKYAYLRWPYLLLAPIVG